MNLINNMLVLSVAVILTGCGFTQSKKDAETVVNRHFQILATNGYAVALDDYSSEFFRKTGREEWKQMLTSLQGRLGNYRSHSVDGWRVFKNAATSGSGTTVEMHCKVRYSKHQAKEIFRLFKGVGQAEYKIVAHEISSEGLLK